MIRTEQSGRGARVPLCDATGCKGWAVGFVHETRDVPKWRHPEDRIRCSAAEVVAVAYYCLEHEKVAKGYQSVL